MSALRSFAVAVLTGALLMPAATRAQSAQDVDKAAQQNQRILQQQQELERQRREQDDARRRAPSGEPEVKPVPVAPSAAASTCSMIKSITFQGATLLTNKELAQLSAPYINKCLTLADINALIAATTNMYIDRGYVTTRLYIPAQDTSSGQLQLLVVEGKVHSLVIKPANSGSVATAFPGVVGGILNLRDLEQGLDQLNRLRSNSATIDIKPGAGPGSSDVLIHNNADKPWQFSFGMDNSGTRATGYNQYSASVGFDNTLGLNDYLNLASRRSGYDSEFASSSSISLYASLPYGYWMFSTSLSDFDYSSLVTGQVRTFQTTGTSKSQSLIAERVVYRDRQTKWSMDGSLTLKNVKNYIEGEKIDSSSHKLSVLNFSTNLTRTWGGWLLAAEVGVDLGVNGFGAAHDAVDLPHDAPHAQYTAYKYSLSLTETFPLPHAGLKWSSELRGQYSDDVLYGTEQFSIGSMFSVRGFRETTISSDRGTYLRNTLGLPFNVGGGELASRIEPYMGFDFGHLPYETPLAGWSVGCQMVMRHGSIQVEYSRPTTDTRSTNENGWLFASANISF